MTTYRNYNSCATEKFPAAENPGFAERHSRRRVLRVVRLNTHSEMSPRSAGFGIWNGFADIRPMNSEPVLGINANIRQFSLLVLINAFVGAMVGLERAILPLIAEEEFHLASRSAILSFIVTFGIVKAAANLFTGRLSDTFGRRRLLITGWLLGIPVPLIMMYAESWHWIVAANLLLGLNQGLCWSAAVIMKIDLAGPKQRGLAMGLNEFSGYVAVSLAALATGYVAATYGLRPQPFYPGLVIAVSGFLLSILLVKDTRAYVLVEGRGKDQNVHPPISTFIEQSERNRRGGLSSFKANFIETSWKNQTLFACCQAGLVNNLNDGMAWGLFPLFFASARLDLTQIGILAAVYPATWGILQLWTGALSDRIGRKWMIAGGMALQGVAIVFISASNGFSVWLLCAALLGLGTSLVYPTLLAAIGDVAHPAYRATAVGIYRFWRDMGYAVGAIIAGLLADWFGIAPAILSIGVATVVSGAIVAYRMEETVEAPARS